MPVVSYFYGIKITMYFGDHSPPHFHVIFAEHEAKIAIDSGRVIAGALPRGTLKLVKQWAMLHKDELATNWNRAMNDLPIDQIEGLK